MKNQMMTMVIWPEEVRMKLTSKLLLLLGAAAAGAAAHKYVKDHREELDRFISEYGEVLEDEYQEEDLIEPEVYS